MFIFRCSFPRACFEKEKDHVEGFAPEVAWVTKGGLEDAPGASLRAPDL